ncbi:flippase [Candidatus Uhrbacteria bacterium]|nr:flippase [Candidatus Uhrbacteria bacterium]
MIQNIGVVKNSFYILLSAVFQKVLTLIYFIIVARYYGPQDQGLYSAALSFTTLMSVFIDLGISSALTRETARDPKAAAPLVSQCFFLRIATGALVYGSMLAVAYLLGYPKALVTLIYVAGIIAVLDTFTVAGWFSVRGFQNLIYEARGGFAAVAVMVAVGALIMVVDLPIFYLLFATLAGSVINLSYSLTVLTRRCGYRLTVIPDWAVMKKLLLISAPFAGAAIFSRLYTFIDMSLLPILASVQAAGLYAAAVKVMLAMNIIPASLSSSLYPAFSALHKKNEGRIGYLCARGIVYLALLALPVCMGLFFLSDRIVLLVYSESYVPTARVFDVLIPGIFFGFLMFPPGALLSGTNRQGVNTAIYGIAALLNIIINIVLIPLYQERGAAIAASVTYTWIFLASIIMVNAHLKPHWKYMGIMAAKAIFATAIMGGVLYLLRSDVPTLLLIAIGIIVYGITIFALRIISLAEISDIVVSKRQ